MNLQCQFIDSINAVKASEWNALFHHSDNETQPYPFICHEFLAALENAGCTTETTGWKPQHLLVFHNSELIAAMPLYLKYHSYGEYVFDWSWADAYARYGLEYYPKLLNAIPFTPSVGPRFGLAPFVSGDEKENIYSFAIGKIQEHAENIHASGFHCLFPSNFPSKTKNGFSTRIGCQFRWQNNNYRTFDEFLTTFNSRKRKSVKKERKDILSQNIIFKRRKASELSSEDWQRFYFLYRDTYLKRSGHDGYLNLEFFLQAASALPKQTLLVTAHKQMKTDFFAAALYFMDSHTLYGRYWGTIEDINGLHFETCYYQGIEYCIENNLHSFDSGAQGEHKIQRGFTPIETCSYHWIRHAEFSHAIHQFVNEEAKEIKRYITDCSNYLPFKTIP
ncbi:GNAT family N-acetyltransferase [Teredinibacter sp. KSP-S5-2]|uniref:GNAT family N-acetyltransferase n=1 Tax=Teredinibacter sp. KSP-S5-2 TaxID=3034506 RepID=UPI002934320A|nr:GNAT family N-acetyltransferase [Teredinibacter sp. KSP-S5-2]WNO09271.1 GNAT family N-acetyltransferase [Teredinibacter sp. KSP-S5-2]